MTDPRIRQFSGRYRTALSRHLKQAAWGHSQPAAGLGRQALALGLETLDLARMHEQAIVTLVASESPSQTRDGMLQRAQAFFLEAITPVEETHRAALDAGVQSQRMNQMLRQRSTKLGDANEQLRHLSRQLLRGQEVERKEISRALHDDIAQTLNGINLHLATLSQEAKASSQGLRRKISRTQRLVNRSVDRIHRFARELRPTVLDDLGLIPALHSLLKEFAKRTGIRGVLTAFAGVEQLSGLKPTVIYRVAQAALANVAQHAQATRVRVSLQRLEAVVRTEIADDGQGFDLEHVLLARGRKRLGLIEMRERVEMVGGHFSVESAPGRGTTVRAEVPFNHRGQP
jgi:two-component system, NarL family, sensor histidine kinase DegS